MLQNPKIPIDRDLDVDPKFNQFFLVHRYISGKIIIMK